MSTLDGFRGDRNISDGERGELLAYVTEMKADGVFTNEEANNLANRVVEMGLGALNDYPATRQQGLEIHPPKFV